MGSYKINHLAALNKISIVVEGFFKPSEAQSYITDYKAIVQKIKTKEYDLEVDASKQAVTDKEVKEIMLEAFKLYNSSGFKSVTIKLKDNPLLKMQCKRILSENGMDIKIVD